MSDLLQDLSCLAHVLLYLYRRNKAALVPGQLFHDLQATVRCAYVTVAQVMHFCPELNVYLFQLGTDNVEQLFSIIRTITHSRNCDTKEFGQRASHACQLADVWARNDGWKKPSDRLGASGVGGVEKTEDHNNPTHWDKGLEGNASVNGVNLKSCWLVGRRDAVIALKAHPLYTNARVEDFNEWAAAGVTMFLPLG